MNIQNGGGGGGEFKGTNCKRNIGVTMEGVIRDTTAPPNEFKKERKKGKNDNLAP